MFERHLSLQGVGWASPLWQLCESEVTTTCAAGSDVCEQQVYGCCCASELSQLSPTVGVLLFGKKYPCAVKVLLNICCLRFRLVQQTRHHHRHYHHHHVLSGILITSEDDSCQLNWLLWLKIAGLATTVMVGNWTCSLSTVAHHWQASQGRHHVWIHNTQMIQWSP